MNMKNDSLDRFTEAQDWVYGDVLMELRSGRKRGHWMWFIFPQIAGLGQSSTSRRYALASVDEAGDYLAHPVLGPRLLECAGILLALKEDNPVTILGHIDAVKLRSCMTLFQLASPENGIFGRVLDKFYQGGPDKLTLELAAAGKS